MEGSTSGGPRAAGAPRDGMEGESATPGSMGGPKVCDPGRECNLEAPGVVLPVAEIVGRNHGIC